MADKDRLPSDPVGDRRRTVATLDDLKHRRFGEFPISGSHAGQPFQLVLMTADCAGDAHLMGLLGRWRESVEAWFQAIFPVTLEGTTRWFRESLVDVEDRALFLVDVEGRHVGHVFLLTGTFHANGAAGPELEVTDVRALEAP